MAHEVRIARPSPATQTLLKRIARTGFLLVTKHSEGDDTYSLGDGSDLTLSRRQFLDLRNRKLILPIDRENLFGDSLMAQRWRARSPDDGEVPKYRHAVR